MSDMWTFKLKNAGNGLMVRDSEGDNLCDVFMTHDPAIAESRARLIAAAPELLEACKSAASHIAETNTLKDHPIGQCPVLDALRVAIAKAEKKL